MTVVLLHAFPLDERMWAGQLPVVPDAIAPRLYGRGRTMDAWAESLASELHGDLTLVGASMGGYCALALARRVPSRVERVLLVGSRPDADSEERRAGRGETVALIRREGPEALWHTTQSKLFADVAHADESLLHRDADSLVEAVEAIRDRADSSETARQLGDRLRFVVGEHDAYVTPGELSDYDVRVVPAAGHLVNLEAPEVFNEQLGEFVRG